jgi:hypothetical protein
MTYGGSVEGVLSIRTHVLSLMSEVLVEAKVHWYVRSLFKKNCVLLRCRRLKSTLHVMLSHKVIASDDTSGTKTKLVAFVSPKCHISASHVTVLDHSERSDSLLYTTTSFSSRKSCSFMHKQRWHSLLAHIHVAKLSCPVVHRIYLIITSVSSNKAHVYSKVNFDRINRVTKTWLYCGWIYIKTYFSMMLILYQHSLYIYRKSWSKKNIQKEGALFLGTEVVEYYRGMDKWSSGSI